MKMQFSQEAKKTFPLVSQEKKIMLIQWKETHFPLNSAEKSLVLASTETACDPNKNKKWFVPMLTYFTILLF